MNVRSLLLSGVVGVLLTCAACGEASSPVAAPTASPSPLPVTGTSAPCETDYPLSTPSSGLPGIAAAAKEDVVAFLAERVDCGSEFPAPDLAKRPDLVNFAGIEVDGGAGVLTLHWRGPVPDSVRDRMGEVPPSVRVVYDLGAVYSLAELQKASAALQAGDQFVAVPAPADGTSFGRPIVICSVGAGVEGRALEVGYCVEGQPTPPADVDPARVAAAIETLTGGVRVVATPQTISHAY